MTYQPRKHHRRSMRLKGYDYTRPGAYFITLCTHRRACRFGTVVNGKMGLNGEGRIVNKCWLEIPHHFPHASVDAFVVMPNHVHGIIILAGGAKNFSPLPISSRQRRQTQNSPVTEGRGTACRASATTYATTEQFGRPVAGSIPTIVRSFKSAVTKRINQMHGTPGAPVWQRNYHERIVRDDNALYRIRQYILNNPCGGPPRGNTRTPTYRHNRRGEIFSP